MVREMVEGLLWILLIVSIGGLIWRLLFVRYPDRGKKDNPQDITNWVLYRLLSAEIRFLSQDIRGEMRWLITFQTGVLIALLGLILSRI